MGGTTNVEQDDVYVRRVRQGSRRASGRGPLCFKVGERTVVMSPHLDTCRVCLQRVTLVMEAIFLSFSVKVETGR